MVIYINIYWSHSDIAHACSIYLCMSAIQIIALIGKLYRYGLVVPQTPVLHTVYKAGFLPSYTPVFFFCQYRIAIRQVQYKLYHWIELQEATVTDLQSHKDLHCFFVLHVKGQISPILHWLQWLAFCMTSCMIPPASSEVAWYNSYIPQRYHVLAIFKAKHITQIRSKGILHSVWALMVDHVSYEFPIYILLLYSLWLAQAGLIEYDHVWSWHI